MLFTDSVLCEVENGVLSIIDLIVVLQRAYAVSSPYKRFRESFALSMITEKVNNFFQASSVGPQPAKV